MSTLGVASVHETSTGEWGRPSRGPVAWALRRLRAPSSFDGIFTPLQRRLGVLWVCVALPTMALWGLLATTPDRYLFLFTFVASGAFTAPTLLISYIPMTRGPRSEVPCYVLWFVGMAALFSVGCAILVNLATGWTFGNALGIPVVVAIGLAMNLGVVRLVRRRSGRRALSVDVIEAVMSVTAVVAPCALLWGEQVVTSDHAWFTIPSAIAVVAIVFAVYWAIQFYVRLGDEAGVLEAVGIALAVLGVVNAGAQVAQGVSGFTLPGPLLLPLHAACMSLLLLVPLYLPRSPMRGLDRLPPQAQVRGGGLAAALTLAGLPVLLAVTVVLDGRQPWSTPFALGVMALLLILAAARHLLTVRETQRLYGHLESASEERRRLLAQVMQRADDDRHRVAAELHEQAVSAYASFVSFIQAAGMPGAPSSPLAGMSTVVRDDLARHADSLRQLMVAIRPIESAEGGAAQTLAAPIHAYVDSLYGDRPAPRLQVSVADGLVLDWVTETIALRIVQEALRNVRAHSHAQQVDVAIGMGDDGTSVEVRVVDDGVGFDPRETMFESGITAMRSFAGVADGRVSVVSAPGVGTSVVACLGGGGGDEGELAGVLARTGGRPRGASATPPGLRPAAWRASRHHAAGRPGAEPGSGHDGAWGDPGHDDEDGDSDGDGRVDGDGDGRVARTAEATGAQPGTPAGDPQGDGQRPRLRLVRN